MFLDDLTKTAIIIAGIDRFYWNLAFCLQLDVSLLLQNFAKIRHFLPELWKCIQWFSFFRTQCTLVIVVEVAVAAAGAKGWRCCVWQNLTLKTVGGLIWRCEVREVVVSATSRRATGRTPWRPSPACIQNMHFVTVTHFYYIRWVETRCIISSQS